MFKRLIAPAICRGGHVPRQEPSNVLIESLKAFEPLKAKGNPGDHLPQDRIDCVA